MSTSFVKLLSYVKLKLDELMYLTKYVSPLNSPLISVPPSLSYITASPLLNPCPTIVNTLVDALTAVAALNDTSRNPGRVFLKLSVMSASVTGSYTLITNSSTGPSGLDQPNAVIVCTLPVAPVVPM